VKKVAKGGEHAYHPKYNDYIENRIRNIYEQAVLNSDNVTIQIKEIENKLQNFSNELKLQIKNECVIGKKRINEIGI